MAPVYTCFRQLHPPTSVEHAVWGSVTGPGKRDLLVARRALLEIYSVPSTAEGGDDDNPILELVGGYPLTASILHIDVVPLGAGSADVIVLALDAAKLTVVAYDAGLGQLVTLSIHNFEAASIGPGSGVLDEGHDLLGAQVAVPATLTAVDPAGRCCATLVGGRHLIILPMRRHLPEDIFVSKEGREHFAAGGAAAASSGTGGKAATETPAAAADTQWTESVGAARASWGRWVAQKPFSVELDEAEVLGTLKHLAFLHGFNEPALALLHEPRLTWGGRLAQARHTSRVTLLSLNLQQGRAPPIWRVAGLPHDAQCIAAPPLPQGGALVLCVNGVVRVCAGEAKCALGVNGFAPVTMGAAAMGCPLLQNEGDYGWASLAGAQQQQHEVFDLADEASPVELDCTCCAFLAPDCALLALREGPLALLRLHPTDGSMTLRTVGSCPPAATLCATSLSSRADTPDRRETGLVFLGSRLGDSLLVGFDAVRGSGAIDAGEWQSLVRVAVKAEENEGATAGGAAAAGAGAAAGGRGGAVWGDWSDIDAKLEAVEAELVEEEYEEDAVMTDAPAAAAVSTAAAAPVTDAAAGDSAAADNTDTAAAAFSASEADTVMANDAAAAAGDTAAEAGSVLEPSNAAAESSAVGSHSSNEAAAAVAAVEQKQSVPIMNGHADADAAAAVIDLTREEEAKLLYGPNWRVTRSTDGHSSIKSELAEAADAGATPAGASTADAGSEDPAAAAAAAESSKTVDTLSVKFTVLDSLPGLGPITTIQVGAVAVGPAPQTTVAAAPATSTAKAAASAAMTTETVPPPPVTASALICSTGYEKCGGIALVWPGLRTDTVAQLPLAQAGGVWTIPSSSGSSASGSSSDSSSGRNSEFSMLITSNSSRSGTGHWTRLLRGTGDTIAELSEEDNPYVQEARTIAAAPLLYGYSAQVYEHGIRLVSAEGAAAQDVIAHEDPEVGGAGVPPGTPIKQAAIGGGFVLLVLGDGALRLLVQESEEEGCDLVHCEPPPHLSAAGAVDTANLFCAPAKLFTPAAPYPSAAAAALALSALSLDAAAASGYTSETEEWAQLYGATGMIENNNSSNSSSRSSSPGGGGGAAAGVTDGNGGPAAMDEEHAEEPAQQQQEEESHVRFNRDAALWTRPEACSVVYCVVCRQGGALEVYSLQQRRHSSGSDGCAGVDGDETADASDVAWTLVFAAAGASGAPSTLWNDTPAAVAAAAATASTPAAAASAAADDDEDMMDATGGGSSSAEAAAAAVSEMDIDADGYGAAPMLNGAAAASPAGVQMNGSTSSSLKADTKAAPAAAAAATAAGETVVYDSVADVLLHPVGAVKAPAALQRLALVLRLSSGDLLVYEARFGAAEAKVACFIKLAHDFIARPAAAAPASSFGSATTAGGRTLSGFTDVSGYRGISFYGACCRAGVVVAERGAVCVLPLGQCRRQGVLCLAGIPPNPLVPSGGFADITGDSVPQFRLLSAAPFADVRITPGIAGAGGCGGGGQGHFAHQNVVAGVTVRRLVRLRAAPPATLLRVRKKPSVLAQLLATPAYAAVVSYKVDVLTEPPEVKDEPAEPDDDEDEEEEEEEPDNSHVNYKNFTAADPKFGGAPPLLVDRFELRLLILSASAAAVAAPSSSSSSAVVNAATAGAATAGSVAAADAGTAAAMDVGAPAGVTIAADDATAAVADQSVAAAGEPTTGVAAEGGQLHSSAGGGLMDVDSTAAAAPAADDEHTAAAAAAVAASGGIEVVQQLPLQRDEHALCLEMVILGPEEDRRPFVICGTGFVPSQGEDSPAKGRLLLYELDYAHVATDVLSDDENSDDDERSSNDGGAAATAAAKYRHMPKLRLAQEKIMSGPIGAAAQLSKFVVTSAGASITVYEWDVKSTQLRPVGIYEASQYVVSMSVVRNYLVLGDAVNSVQFMVWRDEDRSLTQLAKDYEPAEVYSTVFLIDQPALGMVIGDSCGNIKIMRYGPQVLASRGGHKLLCDADFYLGTPAAAMAPVRLRNNKLNAPRFGAAIGGVDGSVSLLAPVDERVYRRLYALQGVLCNALEHGAAANPRGARLFRSPLPAAAAVDGTRMKGVLDGTLLWRFVSLPAATQRELTTAIGTTVEAVLGNLLEIDLQACML